MSSSDTLTFGMGQYEAPIPADRLYVKNHMWVQVRGDVYRFGFSAYAVRLLQDVYFLDWSVAPGAAVQKLQEIGSIESKKADSALYAPMAGQLLRFNEALLADPSVINVDTYGEGWLFEIEGPRGDLLTPAAYVEHLTSAWAVTQRMLKGQANSG